MPSRNSVFAALCQRPETRSSAESIYSLANQRTAQGTGRDLKLGQDALSAICAFLASERQGRGEVSEEQAQTRASLDPKRFGMALAAVRKLVPSSSAAPVVRGLVTFDSLVKQHAVREDAAVAMIEVESELVRSGELDDARIESGSAVVRCAIFHWVCTEILGLAAPGLLVFQQQFKLSKNGWTMVHDLLEEHCSHMVEPLTAFAKTAAATPRATRCQTRTLTKAMGSNSLKHPTSSLANICSTDSIVSKMKRKASLDTGLNEQESPSKRPKDGSYKPSTLGQDVTTHTPKARRTNAAAPSIRDRKTSDSVAIGAQDEDEEVATGTIVVARSTRMSHKPLDNDAWNAQRPTTTAISTKPQPALSTDATMVPSTPMTSTGMSDAPSPDSTPRGSARTQTRTRVDSPPLTATYSSSEEEDEMPRRRRRNLRAPFLDKGAYSWKPSMRTAQALELSRKWEALMIGKYGDPWDGL